MTTARGAHETCFTFLCCIILKEDRPPPTRSSFLAYLLAVEDVALDPSFVTGDSGRSQSGGTGLSEGGVAGSDGAPCAESLQTAPPEWVVPDLALALNRALKPPLFESQHSDASATRLPAHGAPACLVLQTAHLKLDFDTPADLPQGDILKRDVPLGDALRSAASTSLASALQAPWLPSVELEAAIRPGCVLLTADMVMTVASPGAAPPAAAATSARLAEALLRTGALGDGQQATLSLGGAACALQGGRGPRPIAAPERELASDALVLSVLPLAAKAGRPTMLTVRIQGVPPGDALALNCRINGQALLGADGSLWAPLLPVLAAGGGAVAEAQVLLPAIPAEGCAMLDVVAAPQGATSHDGRALPLCASPAALLVSESDEIVAEVRSGLKSGVRRFTTRASITSRLNAPLSYPVEGSRARSAASHGHRATRHCSRSRTPS